MRDLNDHATPSLSFAVDERESGELITAAAAGREGLQFITDQGTPYLAEAAKQAYDTIGLEHAPQREGTPTEKATVERGFGTIKTALARSSTCSIASRLPCARCS